METLNKLISNCMATEALSVSQRIIMEYDSGDWSSEVHFTTIFTELKPLTAKLDLAVKLERAISDLETKNDVRNELIRSLNYSINGYVHSLEPAVKEAAIAVNKIFSKYGVKITQDSYTNESGFISSMLTDFSDPDLQPSIALLGGMNLLITTLTTANNDFETARLKFERESAEFKHKEKATSLKSKVVMLINKKLVKYLRGMSEMDEAIYGQFTRTIGQIIDDVNRDVKRRRNNDDDDPETPNPE